MAATQAILSMVELAQAMRDSDPTFALRVARFEEEFGSVDANTLGVMAQASYFCWFEIEYEQDYLDVCRAIGTGQPTSLYLCQQVSPRRWQEMNTYVVAIQRWLGDRRAPPSDLSSALLAEIDDWLGETIEVKRSLAALLVGHLVVHLKGLTLARLGKPDRAKAEAGQYGNYSDWYTGADGSVYSLESQALAVSALRLTISRMDVTDRTHAQELMSGILMDSQPACQHRFARYLDIKISSIGAMKWRGAVPPDVRSPKLEAKDWFEQQADLKRWLNDESASTDLLRRLYSALGSPDPRKKAMVKDFFYGPPVGAFDWLVQRSATDGTRAEHVFATDR